MTQTDHADDMVLLSRRMMLAGSAVATSLAAAPALGASLPREAGLPSDPKARIALIRRVRLRTDPGLVFWWFRGRNYAQQGATLTPMCELVFGAVMQVIPLAGGAMDVVQYELGIRTALDGDKRAEKLRNPLTGEMIDVPFAPVGPSRTHYDAENTLQLPPAIGKTRFTFEHVPEVFYQAGDTVCFQTHGKAVAITEGQPDRVLNDMSMITSPARQALNPRVACAPAFAHGSDVTDYARWWKMPPGMGTQTLRSVGRKESSFAAMPADWLAALAQFNPAGARDPMVLLNGPQNEYKN